MRASRRFGLAFALAGMLAGCSGSDAPDDKLAAVKPPDIAAIVPAEEALTGVEFARLDPAAMNGAEIRNALGTGPRCEFRYTRAGRPVLAARMQPNEEPTNGVVKLNGNIVVLMPASAGDASPESGSFVLGAGSIRVAVQPDRGPAQDRDGRMERDADMVFEAGKKRRIGYRGYVSCVSEPPMTSDRR